MRAWKGLPGLGTRPGERIEHFDFQPAIDDEGAPPGMWWGYVWSWRAGCRLFGYRGETWLVSIRHDLATRGQR